MAENKTVPTGADVTEFIDSIPDKTRRDEARLLEDLMAEVTGQQPVMWGTAIIGFGSRHVTYASGRELDYFRVGFAPRKAQSVLYPGGGVEQYRDLLPRLGRYSTGKGCLYLKKVTDADPGALRELVERSYRWTQD